jgi:hypothetical protein
MESTDSSSIFIDKRMCWAACSIITTPYFLENRCRSSTFDLQNPQCPICQVALNGQDMITHIQQELDTIERSRHQYKYSTRRSNGQNKVSNHLLFIHKLIIIDYVYQTIIITFVFFRSRFSKKIQLIISTKHLRHVMK